MFTAYFIIAIIVLLVLRQAGRINTGEMIISILLLPLVPAILAACIAWYAAKFLFTVFFKRW